MLSRLIRYILMILWGGRIAFFGSATCDASSHFSARATSEQSVHSKQDYRSLSRLQPLSIEGDSLYQAFGAAFRPISESPGLFEHLYLTNHIYSFVSPSGRFRLWYVLESTDAVPLIDEDFSGVPDWVESGAAAFDYAWRKQVDVAQFSAPPHDQDYAPASAEPIDYGNDEKYDVYFLDLSPLLISGMTQSEWQTSDHPEYFAGFTSYIVIENDFLNKEEDDREDYLWVTAAHEFHHAIQYGYSIDLYRWWMEACATFIESQIFPSEISYVPYVNVFLSHHEYPLWKRGSSREYGAMLFPQFLTLYYGNGDTEIIRQIYQKVAISPSQVSFFDILDDAIQEYAGESFEEAIGRFVAWNYFTGNRDDDEHYSDGFLFRQVNTVGVFSYPSGYTRTGDPDRKPQGLGCNYIELHNLRYISPLDELRIHFDGGEYLNRWSVSLLSFTHTGHCDFRRIAFEEGQATGSIIFDLPNLLDKIVMIPALVSPPTQMTGLTYSYSIEVAPSTKGTDEEQIVGQDFQVRGVLNYPNPFRLRTEFYIDFIDNHAETTQPISLDVYNIAGQKVRTLVDRAIKPIPLFWDGRNDEGNRLGDGVYLYRLEIEGRLFEGKMVLLP
ncbi:MAG: hypothetical protein B6244_09830 [Candidatus Cloacimonetes bacterium 4572_55]|nr:MAG: hypothetical protein B6244_09830 [Candidatus Cloacimonetes bacterium 4572_55]